MQQAGVSLHAIVVGILDFASVEDRERSLLLDQGTRETGGQFATLLTESALVPGLQKLARQLSSQYKVVYGRPDSLVPPDKTEVSSSRPGVAMRGTPARGQTGA
jgi:hypothetical protein